MVVIRNAALSSWTSSWTSAERLPPVFAQCSSAAPEVSALLHALRTYVTLISRGRQEINGDNVRDDNNGANLRLQPLQAGPFRQLSHINHLHLHLLFIVMSRQECRDLKIR